MSLQTKIRDLFLLDQQVRGLCSRVDAAAGRLKAQQTALARLDRQHAELSDQHKQTQVKASTLENQTQEFDARINKLREQMNTVRNNKEYSALLIEVSALKIEKGKVEEQALEQLGKVDELVKAMKELDEKRAQQKKLLAAAETEVATATEEVRAQLEDVTRRRDAAEAELPTDVRAEFARCADIHDGEAMATVIEESRRHREYTCSGCNMGIPVERVNALTRDQDKVVVCSHCGRILYLEPELRQSMGVK